MTTLVMLDAGKPVALVAQNREEKVGGSVLQSVRELSWVPREFKVQIKPCTKR